MIPVLRPLKDPAVATVWSGLAASTIGEDLFRVAVVWIAAEQIGNAAGYVNAAQYGAMLVVGLVGASLFDRWRTDRAMIGAKYFSAVLALLPVAGFYIWGISIPLLVTNLVLVEKVFAVPGMFQNMTQAMGSADFPVLMGMTITVAALVAFATFAVDVALAALDPTIRTSPAAG